MKIILGIFVLLVFLFPPSAQAIEDPLLKENNKFGIHIISESDLLQAAELVNSNGGEWGYVTLVIREDERDLVRWQRAMLQMKELKLIPIIRVATKVNNGVWEKPDPEDAEQWAKFLDSLEWVTKNRYVVLFNEPNHAKEWGGEVNPIEYTRVARQFWQKLKRYSPDFFVLPAGMDAAAPNSTTTMDSKLFFDKMYEEDPEIFVLFDGW